MPIPLIQVGSGVFVDTQDGVGFPITIANGSGEKITNVEFGIRWRSEARDVAAGFVGVLLPGEQEEGTAWEEVDDDTFEPHNFHDEWLGSLDFFVRFTDPARRPPRERPPPPPRPLVDE
jgi:hypothetical protein